MEETCKPIEFIQEFYAKLKCGENSKRKKGFTSLQAIWSKCSAHYWQAFSIFHNFTAVLGLYFVMRGHVAHLLLWKIHRAFSVFLCCVSEESKHHHCHVLCHLVIPLYFRVILFSDIK